MIKFANYQKSKQACMLTILLFGLFFMFRTLIEIKNEVNYLVSTPYGSIYTSSIIGIPFMKAVEYINNNVTSSESILMLPEGVLLNFLTNRSAKSIHINLLPIETELFGEDNVIKDLKKSAPDYIFVNNRNYYNMIFGIHYGQKIFNYIARNYTFQTIYGKSFKIVIFKKNKLNSTVKN